MSGPESSESRRYRVLEILGRGGFGTVYRAELLGAAGFSRTVAIKVLNAEAQGDERLLARLRDEARFLGLLHHRAIVPVHGLVQLAGRWAVILEYVPGCTLHDARRGHGPLPVGVGVEIAEEVASALAEAWETRGPAGEPLHLLHRDIKPGNIQITHQGEVKLLDFGVARADMATREGRSGGMVYGSLPYLSPERLLQRDGPEADVYALGATLLETIGERMPGNVAENPERHRIRLEAGLRGLARAEPPAELVAAITACLAYDPAERPSARQLEHTLRALRRSIPGISLRQWAEDELARIDGGPPSAATGDELTGQVLTEEPIALTGPLGGARRADPTFDDAATLKRIPRKTPAPAPRAATPAPAPRRTPAPVPRRHAPPAGRSWLRVFALAAFWMVVAGLVGTAGVGLVLAGTGVAGAAGLVGLVAMVWPDVVKDQCVEELDRTERLLRATRPGRPAEQVIAHLHGHSIADCRSGAIGMWEYVSFTTTTERYCDDGAITETESRDLMLLYDQIRRP